MRKINDLIVHCAATYDTMDIGVKEIRKVHVDENGWKDMAITSSFVVMEP